MTRFLGGRTCRISALALALSAPMVMLAPTAHAAPDGLGGGWSAEVATVSGGVASGGQLAIDSQRRRLYIADDDFYLSTKGGQDVKVQLEALDPKIEVFDVDSRRPVRSIDFSGQPWGVMPLGPVPVLPAPQVPDGIAVDAHNGRLVTTNSHANGISVVNTDARVTDASNLVSVPEAHPMGVATDNRSGLAYVGLNTANAVQVIDTKTRRTVARIPGLFGASFLAIDQSRDRLYVGNADYMNKTVNYVAVVSLKTNSVIKKITTPSNSRPTVDPTTGRVFAASFDTGKISVIDPDSLTIEKTISTGSTPNNLAIDVQRRLLYAANLQKRTITVIDADSAAVIGTVRTSLAPHTLVVDAKTGTVFATNHQSGLLTVLNVTRG